MFAGISTVLSSIRRLILFGNVNVPCLISLIIPIRPAFIPFVTITWEFFSNLITSKIFCSGICNRHVSSIFVSTSVIIVLPSWKPNWVFPPLIVVLVFTLTSFLDFSPASIFNGSSICPFLGIYLYTSAVPSNSTTSIKPIEWCNDFWIIPSTLIFPPYIEDLASLSVFTFFNVSRNKTAVGIEVFFGCEPGLTVITNLYSFLLIPQNIGAICRFSFLLPAIEPIIFSPYP